MANIIAADRITVLRVHGECAAGPRTCRCCGQKIPRGAPLLANVYGVDRFQYRDNICMACAPDVRETILAQFDAAVDAAVKEAKEADKTAKF